MINAGKDYFDKLYDGFSKPEQLKTVPDFMVIAIPRLDEKVYDGSNQNSLSAWLHIDISKTNNGRVELNDTFGNFEWDQEKSNKNVRGESGTGSGKGRFFSFYFARYAYSDPHLCPADKLVKGKSSYKGKLAMLKFDWLDAYLKDPSIKSRLSPTNSVLFVISENENPKEIVSATFSTEQEYIELYAINMLEKLIAEKESVSWQNLIREKTDAIYFAMKKNLIKQLTKSIVDGTKEFENLIKVNK
jgi:hypothetical protein